MAVLQPGFGDPSGEARLMRVFPKEFCSHPVACFLYE
jgi:hypothetical protein